MQSALMAFTTRGMIDDYLAKPLGTAYGRLSRAVAARGRFAT
jgi:hypothetical protein